MPCFRLKWPWFSLVLPITLSRPHQIASCPTDSESARSYLSNGTGFMRIGGDLGFENFERDIVDTSWHASRNTATTRPNNRHFLLHEGKAWKSEQVELILGLFNLVGCVLFYRRLNVGLLRCSCLVRLRLGMGEDWLVLDRVIDVPV
jgi:hypothetical protein